MPAPGPRLRRLLSPRQIAVFGGEAAAETIRQCRRMGFQGQLWPVHPSRETIEGLPCFRGVADLPEAPDASFIAVPPDVTIDIIGQLAARGAGGAVCYASGFAEAGGSGLSRQRRLMNAAGEMALLGPNCYGVLNYLDRVAMWPDSHGGTEVERGVAIVTQSGNVGLNLTMQRRGLPLAYLISVGNLAVTGLHDVIGALLEDSRVSAIGLHLEGIGDVAAFSQVAVAAHRRRVPIVVLKSGSSQQGAQLAQSHTSSLAGSEVLSDALFARLGIARVRDVAGLLETLMLCHVHGGLSGRRIASASCSGGEASLVADLAEPRGVLLPAFGDEPRRRLAEVLGERVTISNPLDYHTYIWGERDAQTRCFSALLSASFDLHLLVLDLPRGDRCETTDWETTLAAFVDAQERTGAPAAVASSLPEGLPEDVAGYLLARGIAPMHGIADCLDAVAAAAAIGSTHARAIRPIPGPSLPIVHQQGRSEPTGAGSPPTILNEWAAKRALAEAGVRVPDGRLVEVIGPISESIERVIAAAEDLGYPVVVKQVSNTLAHKSDVVGGVSLNLTNAAQVRAAVLASARQVEGFLVERMVKDVVAELIVGVRHDPQFGLALTVGAGGVLVELLRDTVTLLLPVTGDEIRAALESLRIWPILTGHRGRTGTDVGAVVESVMAIAEFAQANSSRLSELDVNPLLALPPGCGAVAVDALAIGWW